MLGGGLSHLWVPAPSRGTHLITQQREIQPAGRWSSRVQTLLDTEAVTLKEGGQAGAVIHDKDATPGALHGGAVSQGQEKLRRAQLQQGTATTFPAPPPGSWGGAQAHLTLGGRAEHLKLDRCHRENPEDLCPGRI